MIYSHIKRSGFCLLVFTFIQLPFFLTAQCEGTKNFGESFFVDLHVGGSDASFTLDGNDITLTFNQTTGLMEIAGTGGITFYTNGSGVIERLLSNVDVSTLINFEAGPVSMFDLANNNGAFGGGNAGFVGIKNGDKFGWIEFQLCGATTCGEYVFTVVEGGVKNTQRGAVNTGDCNTLCEEPEVVKLFVDGLPFVGVIASGVYLAFTEINSMGKVESGANVSFLAGEKIILNPGFHARSGSEFLAALDICEQPSPSLLGLPVAANNRENNAKTAEILTQTNFLFEVQTALANGSYLKTFPNPVNGELTIQCKFFSQDNTDSETQLYLFDMLGRVLVNKTISSNEIAESLNMTELRDGMYHIVLRRGDQMLSDKIVKIL